MTVNLMRDLGFDEGSEEVRAVRETAQNYGRLVDELRCAREAAGLSVHEVADRMGSRPAVVAGLESGRVDERFSVLARYARAVGARLSVVVTHSAEQSAQPERTSEPESDAGARRSGGDHIDA